MKKGNQKIVVIGGGPGGYPAAIKAAQLGAQVVLVDNDRIGGVCLHRGCIPTKFLLKRARDYQNQIRLSEEMGIANPPRPNMVTIMQQKAQVVEHLTKGISSLLLKNGIRIISGTASFIDPMSVRIVESEEVLEASAFIIASGSESIDLPIEGMDLPGVFMSDQILNIESLPRSLVILGGGVIGLEFAQLFHNLHVEVTILEMLPTILTTEDEEISAAFLKIFKSSGITVHTDTKVKSISQANDKLQVSYNKGQQDYYISAEKVLVAVGRRPYTQGLGIREIGLKLKGDAVEVNKRMETNIPNIYAVGDVAGGLMLAHKASAEGECAAQNAMERRREMSYQVIPRVMYTSPEVASVGFLEEEARVHCGDVLIGRFPFSMNSRAVLEESYQGFVKVIADAESKCIVGMSILGPQASHLIGEATLAIQMEATLEDMAEIIHAHPTFSEALHEAILDAQGEAIHLPPHKTGKE